MKLLTYQEDGCERVGVMSADLTAIHPLSELGWDYGSMQALIEGASAETLRAMAARVAAGGGRMTAYGAVTRCAPIPELRRDMICIGYNFRSHAEEIAHLRGESAQSAAVSHPIYFSKRTAMAGGDGAPIPFVPGYAENLDCGVEVAVVIGRDACNVAPEDVGDYIFGYTIANDVCDTRLNRVYTQPFLGKSIDGYMPVGPWIVTADEFPRDPVFRLRLLVNGAVRQEGSTDQLVFGIAQIVSELSQNMTLKAGTLISTGSPANLDAGNPEKLLLLPGDEICCEISGIGTLTNPVTVRELREGAR